MCKCKYGNGAVGKDWGRCSEKTMCVNDRQKECETEIVSGFENERESLFILSPSVGFSESALEEVRDVLGWPPSQSGKHSAGGCSQRSDTFLLNCSGCLLPAWKVKKIVWGGTDDYRISKRGSCGTYHSSWAGSCNLRWDGIILCFHIVCPFVFPGTIWRSKCSLAWVWPCIIYITVIVFYSIACGIKARFWTEYMEMWLPFVRLDLVSCSGCSSEDWETRMCLHTDRNIKK